MSRTIKSQTSKRLRIHLHPILELAGIGVLCFTPVFAQSPTPNSYYELKRINLPGANGVVALDYFAYHRATGKVWVPASNTGSVDVIDEKTDAVSQITGFPTGEIERRGRKITVGPTAASIGDGVVYIGDRGNATICIIDARTLARGECVPASADRPVTPDGVVYVAAT